MSDNLRIAQWVKTHKKHLNAYGSPAVSSHPWRGSSWLVRCYCGVFIVVASESEANEVHAMVEADVR